jgi:hypothetical protein
VDRCSDMVGGLERVRGLESEVSIGPLAVHTCMLLADRTVRSLS